MTTNDEITKLQKENQALRDALEQIIEDAEGGKMASGYLLTASVTWRSINKARELIASKVEPGVIEVYVAMMGSERLAASGTIVAYANVKITGDVKLVSLAAALAREPVADAFAKSLKRTVKAGEPVLVDYGGTTGEFWNLAYQYLYNPED